MEWALGFHTTPRDDIAAELHRSANTHLQLLRYQAQQLGTQPQAAGFQWLSVVVVNHFILML